MANVAKDLKEMVQDLKSTKASMVELKKMAEEFEPEDFDFEDEGEDFGKEPEEEKHEDEEEGAVERGEEEEKPEIKTPEEAKEALETAKEDIEDVIEHLDSVTDEGEEEEKKASFRRKNDKYASNLSDLAKSAKKAIADADRCVSYWKPFLSKQVISSKHIQNDKIKEAVQTVKEAHGLMKMLGNIFSKEGKVQKEATATPPTRSVFTGDKWPSQHGDSSEVEVRAWEAGAKQFHKDNDKYNPNPNASDEPRLVDEVDPHDEKPYIESSFVYVRNNPKMSGWKIYDSRARKQVIARFKNLPADIGPKNPQTFKEFSSKKYGTAIIKKVAQLGLEPVRKELHGLYAKKAVLAAVEDKSTVRKYFADAYGDSSFAREMTGSYGSEEDMADQIDYKPEFEKVRDDKEDEPGGSKDGVGKITSLRRNARGKTPFDRNEGEDEFSTDFDDGFETDADDGGNYHGDSEHRMGKRHRPGNVEKPKSEQDQYEFEENSAYDEAEADKEGIFGSLQEKKAKAYQAVELARKFAAVGQIDYTKDAIAKKASEIMNWNNSKYAATSELLGQFKVVVPSALKDTTFPKEAHLPESEKGVVGNAKAGVRDPQAEVDTEGEINSDVAKDAEIKKHASFVPQGMSRGSESDDPRLKNISGNILLDSLQRRGVVAAYSGKNRVMPVHYKE